MVSKRKVIFQTDQFKSYYDYFHFITKQSIESIKSESFKYWKYSPLA